MTSAIGAAKSIERIGIVGCGVMGTGIAETCARAGLDVRVVASGAAGVDRGRARLDRSLAGAVRKGKLDAADRDALTERIVFTTDLDEIGRAHV